MRIAVACDGLEVAEYYSRSTSYMCYTIERGVIVSSRNMPAVEQPSKLVADLLTAMSIDTVIVGLIEYDVATRLCRAGIEVVAGASGEALEVVKAYMNKTLMGIDAPCEVGELPA